MLYYTGVGARKTPEDILKIMRLIAQKSALTYVLRSGGADGADTAFEQGCNAAHGQKEIYYAKDATAAAMKIAARFHPAWDHCSEYAKKLHGRNAFQILGANLNTPSNMLICWTPDGCIHHSQRTLYTGGTGTAISIAEAYKVPIWNLAIPEHLKCITNWLWRQEISTAIKGNVTVINKYKYKGPYIYIGRPSVFGNPFPLSIGREECIAKYKEHLYNEMNKNSPLNAAINNLIFRVKHGEHIILGCFCKPLHCHGDEIAAYIMSHLN